MVERSSTVDDGPVAVLVDVHLAVMEVHDCMEQMSELQCSLCFLPVSSFPH